jgi:hypothetical protein
MFFIILYIYFSTVAYFLLHLAPCSGNAKLSEATNIIILSGREDKKHKKLYKVDDMPYHRHPHVHRSGFRTECMGQGT